ncbi:phospholipid-translocating ATPase [Pancytospora philotis]|nr:phospholipid-translocating ATPase [Pancytospora philotis]
MQTENVRRISSAAPDKHSNNEIRNTKYTRLNFFPSVLLLQFQSFSSFYFVAIMVAQLFPQLAISSFWTSLGPWLFVLLVSMFNEGLDDFKRHKRDKESNSELYKIWRDGCYVPVKSANIKTGDLLLVEKGDRMPADGVLLKSEEASGEIFIRTDQLDGETDWKRRVAPTETQECGPGALGDLNVTAELPHRGIYNFTAMLELARGTGPCDNALFFAKEDGSVRAESPKAEIEPAAQPVAEAVASTAVLPHGEDSGASPAAAPHAGGATTAPEAAPAGGEPIRLSLDLDNTIWANTIVATSSALCLVVYTGDDTRSMMNTYKPRSKIGKIDKELDRFTQILGISSFIAAAFFTINNTTALRLTTLFIFLRFLMLFSYVIPISLKVTINLARICYVRMVQTCPHLQGVIVRSSSMQEELGRISFFLTDKTGTLTKNEMVMKKVHLGTTCYTAENLSEIRQAIKASMKQIAAQGRESSGMFRKPKTLEMRVYELIEALSVCHAVTPVESDGEMTYQASSPDEVAIVNYIEKVGMQLVRRDRTTIVISSPLGNVTYRILQIFPFNSDTKRMGIIVQRAGVHSGRSSGEEAPAAENGLDRESEILFFEKGADSAMKKVIRETEWAEEETDNMARDGLRTLMIAKRVLSLEEYDDFCRRYEQAKLAIGERLDRMLAEQVTIEKDLELLGLTGVEDKLQDNVRQTLENLRNAGMKVWMLTGDKIETAISIAMSSRLLNKADRYIVIANCATREEVSQKLRALASGRYNALVIDGVSLAIVIDHSLNEFITAARDLNCVVGCRYSPTQKAVMAAALRKIAKETVCCIGDGGNDVSMITEADIGVGIEGKEGNQASLAADFSIKQFANVADLFFWHGRRCYKNTSSVAGIIIHRGTMIAMVQAIFCALIYYVPISVFQGKMLALLICYTFPPLYSLIRTQDVPRATTLKFPELYQELRRTNLLSVKNLFAINVNSFFQASAIVLLLFVRVRELFALSILVFTCIVINEQALICLTIEHINKEVLSLCGLSLLLYMLSFFIVNELSAGEFTRENIPNLLLANFFAISLKLVLRVYRKWFRPASHAKLGTQAY